MILPLLLQETDPVALKQNHITFPPGDAYYDPKRNRLIVNARMHIDSIGFTERTWGVAD